MVLLGLMDQAIKNGGYEFFL